LINKLLVQAVKVETWWRKSGIWSFFSGLKLLKVNPLELKYSSRLGFKIHLFMIYTT